MEKKNLHSGLKLTTIRNLLTILILSAYLCFWWNWMTSVSENPQMSTNEKNLNHFRKSRNLTNYIHEIRLLREPQRPPCNDKLLILVMVATAPSHSEERNAIRNTWATRLPTLFILGLKHRNEMQYLNDNYEDDLVVYEFNDHYQNLTLKTALMLKWASEKCSSVNFLLKTDDDILLNPWQLERIVQNNPEADLIGYRMENAELYRRQDNKWYLPRWLYPEDIVPEYLSGNAYLINGKYIKTMLKAAYEVPLINIEDIYFTYLVAKRKLDLKLTNEEKLYGFRPWFPLGSSYWKLASAHSLTPTELLKWWSKLLDIKESE